MPRKSVNTFNGRFGHMIWYKSVKEKIKNFKDTKVLLK
jgi:hypothetical protein